MNNEDKNIKIMYKKQKRKNMADHVAGYSAYNYLQKWNNNEQPGYKTRKRGHHLILRYVLHVPKKCINILLCVDTIPGLLHGDMMFNYISNNNGQTRAIKMWQKAKPDLKSLLSSRSRLSVVILFIRDASPYKEKKKNRTKSLPSNFGKRCIHIWSKWIIFRLRRNREYKEVLCILNQSWRTFL